MLNIFAYIDKIADRKAEAVALHGNRWCCTSCQDESATFRRFRSAKDAKDALEELETKVDSSQVFDSNCITPGTQFMARLISVFVLSFARS